MFVPLQPQNQSDISLGYGVMVTLQILVLSFLVRIQVAQPNKKEAIRSDGFLFCIWTKLSRFRGKGPVDNRCPL